VLDGKTTLEQLPRLRSSYIKEQYRKNRERFSTVYLEQPIRGMPNAVIGDRISADHEVWR
jgi:hypothetical protein